MGGAAVMKAEPREGVSPPPQRRSSCRVGAQGKGAGPEGGRHRTVLASGLWNRHRSVSVVGKPSACGVSLRQPEGTGHAPGHPQRHTA